MPFNKLAEDEQREIAKKKGYSLYGYPFFCFEAWTNQGENKKLLPFYIALMSVNLLKNEQVRDFLNFKEIPLNLELTK